MGQQERCGLVTATGTRVSQIKVSDVSESREVANEKGGREMERIIEF